MASGRMLKKEISDSDKLGAVKTDRARVLWFMMLPHLDVAERLEANVRRIKGQITTMLPYSEKAIQVCLEQLHDSGLITLYKTSNKQYLEYTRFDDFQNLNPDREAESTIPPPNPEDSRVIQRTPLNIKLSKDKLKVSKDKYIDFVFLTSEEYKKLIRLFGEQGTKDRIAALNDYIGSKGKKYKSHYHTILTWDRKNGNTDGKVVKKLQLFPIKGKNCSEKGCNLPAVYKDASGNYDNYKCAEHMPQKVKELYA